MEKQDAETLITALLNSQRYLILALKTMEPKLTPLQDATLLQIMLRNEEIAFSLGLTVETIPQMIQNANQIAALEKLYKTPAPAEKPAAIERDRDDRPMKPDRFA